MVRCVAMVAVVEFLKSLSGRPMSIQQLGSGVTAGQGSVGGVRQQQRGKQQQQQSTG